MPKSHEIANVNCLIPDKPKRSSASLTSTHHQDRQVYKQIQFELCGWVALLHIRYFQVANELVPAFTPVRFFDGKKQIATPVIHDYKSDEKRLQEIIDSTSINFVSHCLL